MGDFFIAVFDTQVRQTDSVFVSLFVSLFVSAVRCVLYTLGPSAWGGRGLRHVVSIKEIRMGELLQITRQRSVEERFNRKLIDIRIRKELAEYPENQGKIDQGVQLLVNWLAQDYYPSKNARLNQLKTLELRSLVEEIFVGIAYFQKPELFTSVTAQLAGRLGFDDKADAIKTMAEMLAVLCITDAFDIGKEHKMASLMLRSRLYLSTETKEFIEGSEYLPPMVCEPCELKSNYDSGYLTHKDSLILGKGNHHDGDICLDVLNIMNSVCLKLDTEFLSKLEEEPTFELDTAEKRDMWMDFKRKSYEMYMLMVKLGNRFYFTHKVDKRGRIYAQGYHLNTQGTSFKKAMLELANEEVVTGVPQ